MEEHAVTGVVSVVQFANNGKHAHRLTMPFASNPVGPILRQTRVGSAASRDGLTRDELIAQFYQLKNEFGVVSRKIEALSQLSCLKRPGFIQLAQLSAETMQLVRLVNRELQVGTDPLTVTLPDPLRIDQLIEQCSDYQDRLQRQLALVAQLREDAVELRDELNLLVIRGRDRTGSLSFDGIKALTRRVISELVCDVTPPVLHPQLALDVLTELFGNRAEAEIHAIAFASAQSVARVARVTWLRSDQVELVTAAALLQDCGKLLTDQPESSFLSIHNPQTVDHHPLVGSAIVAGYRDVPPGLASLIAQHHERLNGSGHPFRLEGVQLSGFARLLAVSSRLERLRIRFAFESDLLAATDQAESPAMLQLWSEAMSGEWDLTLTRKLLIQRDAPVALQNSLDASFNQDLDADMPCAPIPSRQWTLAKSPLSSSRETLPKPHVRTSAFKKKTGS